MYGRVIEIVHFHVTKIFMRPGFWLMERNPIYVSGHLGFQLMMSVERREGEICAELERYQKISYCFRKS